jgi:excisionase family DNA binding protein
MASPEVAQQGPPKLSDLPPVMKVPEVAGFLRCDSSTVYQLIQRCELDVVRLGRSFRVTRDALERFVAGTQHDEEG